MLRKFMLAAIAAASLGVTFAGATPASAEHWDGPRYGSHGPGYGYGPPPWVMRRWHWRRHQQHYGPPAHHGPRERHFGGRPGPFRPHW
jgi:hypothetical protein